jgi:hypothetical protein
MLDNRLKRMIIFEDFDDTIITHQEGLYHDIDAEFFQIADAAVSRAVAKASFDPNISQLHHRRRDTSAKHTS